MSKSKQTEKLKPFLPLIIVGGILGSILIGWLVVIPYFGLFNAVPQNVLKEYEQGPTLGLGGKSLALCTKGKSRMYEVGFHNGFGGELHYYTEHGAYMGTNNYEDHPTFTPDKVNTEGYKCRSIEDEKRDPSNSKGL